MKFIQNQKGKFTFASPFDSLVDNNKEFTIHSIRSLLELQKNEDSPLETIYLPVGLTQADFNNDLTNNINIVVFTTDGCEFFYVPENRVLSLPQLNGVRYQEKILAIHLGNIPIDLDLTVVKDSVKSIVNDALGIDSKVEEVLASAVNIVDKQDHDIFMALLNNNKTVTKSDKTLYLETLALLEEKQQLIDNLQEVIKNKICNA